MAVAARGRMLAAVLTGPKRGVLAQVAWPELKGRRRWRTQVALKACAAQVAAVLPFDEESRSVEVWERVEWGYLDLAQEVARLWRMMTASQLEARLTERQGRRARAAKRRTDTPRVSDQDS